MKKLMFVAVLALSLSVVLAACSSAPTLNVTVRDFSYTPNAFTVQAGAKVNLRVTNAGSVEHEFAIMKKGQTVTPPFGDKDEPNIYWELDEIQPGETKSATFTAPADPGDYEVVCGLPGHIENGMTATITVK